MKVYQSIQAVMKELGEMGIGKGGTNKDQGYKFRGIDAVYLALNPLLVKHNLVVLPRHVARTQSERPTKTGGLMTNTIIDIEFDFVNTEDFSKHTVRICGEGADTADKSTNKANSAAYKYAMFETFCIPTEAVDGDAESPQGVASASKLADGLKSVKTLMEAAQYWSSKIAPVFNSLSETEQFELTDIKNNIKERLK